MTPRVRFFPNISLRIRTNILKELEEYTAPPLRMDHSAFGNVSARGDWKERIFIRAVGRALTKFQAHQLLSRRAED